MKLKNDVEVVVTTDGIMTVRKSGCLMIGAVCDHELDPQTMRMNHEVATICSGTGSVSEMTKAIGILAVTCIRQCVEAQHPDWTESQVMERCIGHFTKIQRAFIEELADPVPSKGNAMVIDLSKINRRN